MCWAPRNSCTPGSQTFAQRLSGASATEKLAYLYYSVTDGGLELPQTTTLSTVLGGWIADRLLSMQPTVLYGGVVVMFGHIGLAIVPGLAGAAVGLVLVALGLGQYVAFRRNLGAHGRTMPNPLPRSAIGWIWLP